MKRIGNLIPQVAEFGNLGEAFYRAARGKRAHPTVRTFQANLAENLARLSSQIRSGTVPVGHFHRFVVRDPKTRLIHAAAFRERVLHHAIMNVAGEIFERGAISHSYACRIGKGNSAAVARALKNTTARPFVLKLDVRRFFDSVDHTILRRRFDRVFKDPGLLTLLGRIVESFETAPGIGLPIGTLTSQYFANFYLDPLDRFVTERLGCGRYVRFMDDFVLWGRCAESLGRWREEIIGWLGDRLALEVKEVAEIRRCRDGFPFLGYRLRPGKVLLGRAGRRRYRRRLGEVEEAALRGEIGTDELQRRVTSLTAFTDHADCRRWRGRVIANESLNEVLA